MAQYKEAVAWIAMNDNPAPDEDVPTTAGYLTVVLVADIWHKTPEDVAADVVRVRRKWMSSY